MITFDEDKRRLLFKEASLSAMNLGVGLTFLRRSNFTQLGYIYQSFFSLSIGLERLLKLILIYEYFGVHNSFPTNNNYLKSKGHNLIDLFNEAEKLSGKYNCQNYFQRVSNELICKNILHNLSDFAVKNRYFHLDDLANSAYTSTDPLKRWDVEVNDLVLKKHQIKNSKNLKGSLETVSKSEGNALIRFVDEQDKSINSLSNLILEGFKTEKKQKYSVFYTYLLIRALCELQENQNRQLYSNAFLYEFFTTFRYHSDAYVLRKKTWNIYSPYRF